jgi:hypothetical protein
MLNAQTLRFLNLQAGAGENRRPNIPSGEIPESQYGRGLQYPLYTHAGSGPALLPSERIEC